MTAIGWFQILVFVAAIVAVTRPLGASIGDLIHDRPVLLLFYLFDWSST